MTISDKGLKIIERFEGFKSCPYKDVTGTPTTGIGSTFYENGTKVTMADPCITHDRAIELLKSYLKNTEKVIADHIKVSLTQNQFDALCSLDYNIGDGNFELSTLVKEINKDPNDADIRNQFMRWIRSKGEVIQDLVRRRAQEAALYYSV